MRRIPGPASESTALTRLLDRAPRGLRGLLGRDRAAFSGGEVEELAVSARKLGPVLQVSVSNPSRVFLSSIELSLLVEFYDREHTAQERRTVEFLSPSEEVMLAIPVESPQVSRVWCTTNYTLRGQRHTATGGVDLA